jgi:putative ABC transport system substrate-binding protein
MKRRKFMAMIGGAAASAALPRAAIAQAGKVYRLGVLSGGAPVLPNAGPGAILINSLAQQGYRLGQNLIFEMRASTGKSAELPRLMQELKAAKVDVVVTISYPAAVAAG